MKKQVDIFFTALMFFTRIPVPSRTHHGADMLEQSTRYFSWIGIIVGVVSGGIYVLLAQFFSPAFSLFGSMLGSILVTGAFHEDGFADVCDAFGGGWTKEKILLIMKDSRLGTYGVIGLMAMLGLKFLLLFELAVLSKPSSVFMTVVAAHALSRLAAVTIIQEYKYVTEQGSKSKPVASRRLHSTELIIASAGGILPLLFMNQLDRLAVIPVALARIWAGRYFYKWIGGYTGDCLGATQQVAEIGFYTGILIIWKCTS